MGLNIMYKLFITIVVAVTVAACASKQPLSNYARTGDTVLVSLGGTDTNAMVPVLRKESIVASITDSANSTYPVKVRNLFRVYSDPTSKYGYSGPKPVNSQEGEVEEWVPSHMGLWLAVIDLQDPATGQAPGLATGQGRLSVSSPELSQWIDYTGFGWSWTNGNLDNIPLEILPGVGGPNPLNYMQPYTHYPLNSLESVPHIEIRANVPPEFNNIIAGGTFVFRYVTANFGGAAGRRPRVTTTAADPNVQLASRYVDQGDGTTLLTVLIGNPHGFRPDNSKDNNIMRGQSLLRSLRFNIMWRDPATPINDENWQSSLQFISGNYVDLNGHPLNEVTPMIAKVY